jgi:GT2 family glycosyltransferase
MSGEGDQSFVSVSVVSHGHTQFVVDLLDDLARCRPGGIEVILTLNIEERLPFVTSSFPFSVRLVRNASPRGFAANHNAALPHARGPFFCVMNPDIRLTADPFPALIEELQDPVVGVAAPLITDPGGAVEDSARPFPTPFGILCKAAGLAPKLYYDVEDKSISPDWVAGMFMLFRQKVFAEIGGFDTAYHLYYEDADLCARLRIAGYDVRLVPKAMAVHIAQRQSHRNPKHFFWHLQSMLRFFFSGTPRAARQVVGRRR